MPILGDWLMVNGLTVLSKVGCLPVEQSVPQPIEVDIALEMDLREVAKTDDIRKGVDYRKVCNLVRQVLEQNSFKLLETAAYAIAVNLLRQFPKVERVRVEVRKPHPPIPVPLQSASVMMELSRDEI
ncbi:dihydroneopterin aldolase [Fervidibacter sacchari]|uniref:dihydroneopterin aldolase n=1 Tax=Candidatus Fervidibacter sacchari TaxID=1448929 RepID=UPI0021693C69|nr:dihydroneopterin aldolase [Candidatus Fervidibacter sacchari]WKU16098.1 dihydroneopterin aldolase [Candidatus Fervidibacter sacchari]